tara:strand:+ start:378 stop:539 length:162 start_codon:yes stop_codon:yes gene_type:complete
MSGELQRDTVFKNCGRSYIAKSLGIYSSISASANTFFMTEIVRNFLPSLNAKD